MVLLYISKFQEILALTEHIISFACTWITMYSNRNSNIQFLALMDMWQHFVKIFRILFYGFELKGAPIWFCVFHSFLNYFSHNCVIILSCFIIYNLYFAMKHPLYFAKYNKKIRPYVFFFTMVYISIFVSAALYEPVFQTYSDEEIKNRNNCSSAYRYRLYQYLLTSPLISIHFTLIAIYCTIVIIHKIKTTPKSTIRNQIIVRTRIPLKRWINILIICCSIALLSFLNLFSDIKNGLHPENEKEKIGILYYFTASSGIIIFLLTVSQNQLKRLFGIKVVSNHCFEYGFSNSMEESAENKLSIFGSDENTNRHHHIKKNGSKESNPQSKNSISFTSSNTLTSNSINHSHSSHFINAKLLKSQNQSVEIDPSTLNFNLPHEELDDEDDEYINPVLDQTLLNYTVINMDGNLSPIESIYNINLNNNNNNNKSIDYLYQNHRSYNLPKKDISSYGSIARLHASIPNFNHNENFYFNEQMNPNTIEAPSMAYLQTKINKKNYQ